MPVLSIGKFPYCARKRAIEAELVILETRWGLAFPAGLLGMEEISWDPVVERPLVCLARVGSVVSDHDRRGIPSEPERGPSGDPIGSNRAGFSARSGSPLLVRAGTTGNNACSSCKSMQRGERKRTTVDDKEEKMADRQRWEEWAVFLSAAGSGESGAFF